MVSLEDTGASLSVLGGFAVRAAGERLSLPVAVQRMLGFLALTGQRQSRGVVAGRLWPQISEARAQANLRTALWQLRRTQFDVVQGARDQLWLSDHVAVDYRVMIEQALRVLNGAVTEADLLRLPLPLFEADLLPGWDEDWLLIERERHRQLRMHALEAISRRLMELGQHALAADAAYAAIAIEPLCESAHRTLAQVFLAEGNPTEALRQFELYRRLLNDDTGFGPTDEFVALVRPRRPPTTRDARVVKSALERRTNTSPSNNARRLTTRGFPERH